jgi:fatty-acyl-CoA synthase
MGVGDWPAKWAIFAPERPALEDLYTGKRYTYGELNRVCGRLAHTLATSYGVRRGDRVGWLARTRAEFFVLYFATARIGAILVSLNWRLSAEELRPLLAHSDPTVLVYGRCFARTVERIAGGCKGLRLVVLEDEELEYDPAEGGARGEASLAGHTDLETPHLILYTSGTTGRPKGVVITHRQTTWNAINTLLACELTGRDSTLTFTPLFHTGGINVLSVPLFYCGGTVFLQDAFDPEAVLRTIERERITTFFGVPAIYSRLAERPVFREADLSSLRFALCGGAPCPVELIRAYARKGVVFRQGYGLTEVGPNCFSLRPEDAVRKAGSIGFPIFHCEARIVDETDRDVARGGVGELLLRGPHVMAGYWRDPEATGKAVRRGGWFATGDLVRRDEEGYFYVAGRKKDMYISGGENVYPAELEAVLLRHPEIADAAVVGIPDATWGEVGLAAVVPASGAGVENGEPSTVLAEPGMELTEQGTELTAQKVIAYLRDRVAHYKVPRRVVFLTELPRTESGKVVKPEIARIYGVERGGASSRGVPALQESGL